jgi:hypothetical protein
MDKLETNPWANLAQIEDFMAKEIFPKLTWGDIKNLQVALVNKAWRALFTSNRVWKSFFQSEWPFVDINNTTDHYQKFKDTWASFHSKRLFILIFFIRSSAIRKLDVIFYFNLIHDFLVFDTSLLRFMNDSKNKR